MLWIVDHGRVETPPTGKVHFALGPSSRFGKSRYLPWCRAKGRVQVTDDRDAVTCERCKVYMAPRLVTT